MPEQRFEDFVLSYGVIIRADYETIKKIRCYLNTLSNVKIPYNIISADKLKISQDNGGSK